MYGLRRLNTVIIWVIHAGPQSWVKLFQLSNEDLPDFYVPRQSATIYDETLLSVTE